MTTRKPGRIVTFYSYKGGTGRSMTLANLAWVLASNGRRVLVIDWDLEAPGLHRYLHPFLVDPELRSTQGLIDLVTQYATRAITPANIQERVDKPWYDDLADLTGYVFSIDYRSFAAGGTFDFLPAGRQGPAYASRVTSFDWPGFYGRLGGGAFLDEVSRRARSRYDYILIDSRTGVSDTSGICTVQLPDVLVVCFTLNRQSIEGAAAVAESATSQRRDLRVLPVPSRVELGEKERLDAARDYAYGRFAGLLGEMSEVQRDEYWASVEVLYQPFYAYEEVLAPFADRPRQPTYILAAAERLAKLVTDGDVERSVPPPDQVRTEVLARYLRRPSIEPSAETSVLREALVRQEVAAATAINDLAASRRRARWLTIGAAAVVVAGIAVGAVVFFSNGSTSTAPQLTVQPESLDFGDVAVDDNSEMTLKFESTSSSALDLSVSIDGTVEDGKDAFAIVADDCTGQHAGTFSCELTIKYRPFETGRNFFGDLHMFDGVASEPIHVDLTGTGTS